MNEDKDKQPLIPRSAAGAAVVGIPVAALMTGAGWLGQKIIALDEQTVRIQNELENRESLVISGQEIGRQIATVIQRLDKQKEDMRRIEVLLVRIDEDVVMLKTKAEDFEQEIGILRKQRGVRDSDMMWLEGLGEPDYTPIGSDDDS